MFTRFYTEPACTPSWAACMTGRHAARSGMYAAGFPVEAGGLPGEEATIAEVLSKAGYATAFYGRWRLGDIEESYPHNQGFDETFFTPYNQVTSLLNEIGEGANAARPASMLRPYRPSSSSCRRLHKNPQVTRCTA